MSIEKRVIVLDDDQGEVAPRVTHQDIVDANQIMFTLIALCKNQNKWYFVMTFEALEFLADSHNQFSTHTQRLFLQTRFIENSEAKDEALPLIDQVFNFFEARVLNGRWSSDEVAFFLHQHLVLFPPEARYMGGPH